MARSGDALRETVRRFVCASSLAALVVLGCDGSTGPDSTTDDEIVHHAWADQGAADIYAVRADGAQSRQLTNSPGDDVNPAVSPNGARVAFVSDRDGNYEIYTIDADGSGLVRITNDPGVDTSPAWSPDGQRLVFVSDRNGGEWELYTVGADGSGLTRLTTNTVVDLSPHWSPDGARIAVSRDRDEDPGSVDVYVLNSDGTNPVQLTHTRMQEFQPRWSPNGRRIAFIADTVVNPGRQRWAMVVIEADGSRREQLTAFSDAGISGFTWSPDGTRIVFDQYQDLWVVDVRNKSVTKLTDTPTMREAAPSWRRVR